MKKLHVFAIVLILLFLNFVLPGCSGTFQAKKTTPVSSLEVVTGYASLTPEIGILYDYFTGFNAFTDAEADIAMKSYQGIIAAISKLKRKTTAGKVDYHRLLYFTEDVTEYWEDLRGVLNTHVETGLPGASPYADALYIRVRDDVDAMLALANVRLRAAEGAMDKAAYDQFREDAQNLISTMSPLFQKGVDILL